MGAGALSAKRPGACAEQTLARLFRYRCGCSTSSTICPSAMRPIWFQVEAALCVPLLRDSPRGARKHKRSSPAAAIQRATHGEQQFPNRQARPSTRRTPYSQIGGIAHGAPKTASLAMRRKDSLHSPMPTGAYSIETLRRTRNYACGAYTGLRNTPTPANTDPRPLSPAKSGTYPPAGRTGGDKRRRAIKVIIAGDPADKKPGRIRSSAR